MARLRVGLTGGIASGKSVVSEALRRHGAIVIDNDLLARQVVEPGTPGLAALTHRFGRGVIDSHGALDRKRLGEIVFADPSALADLDDIVHPLSRAGTMTRPAIRARRVEIATRNRPRCRRPKAGNFVPATERAAKACQPPDSRWPAKR